MPKFDIFISYARKDSEWVLSNLIDPLQQCRNTLDGRRPSIFFDVGEKGVKIGVEWRDAVVKAIGNSDKIVLVYSFDYFDSPVCKFETDLAQTLRERGQATIYPILIYPAAEKFIPLAVASINYLKAFEPEWFARLCDSLGLRAAAPQEQTSLEFQNQPEDITANHTLPAIRVALTGADGGPPPAEEITMSCEGGGLQGTTAVKTSGGIATFTDLSIDRDLAATRLRASARGLEPVFSRTFAVLAPATAPDTQTAATIKPPGEALFFADGKALAVVRPGGCSVYDLTARSLLSDPAEVNLEGRLRLWHTAGPLLAMATWSGQFYLFSSDGRCWTWDLGSRQSGFQVPGDLAFAGEEVLVGFWNGTVYRLFPSDGSFRVEFRNETGVQALAASQDRVYVCGFDSMLRAYRDGRLVNSYLLEPSVRLVKKYENALVAVGDKNIYQIDLAQQRVMSEKPSLAGITQVWGDTELPVIMDGRGKGIRIDSELAVKASFWTTPGAMPVSADNAGSYCIFRNPDGLRTLLKGEHIVFTHLGGTFAVAPGGDFFALGEEAGIRLLTVADLEPLIEGGVALA